LFFVSVGMLFDPATLLHSPLELLAIVAVILLCKALVAYAIVRAFRFPPRVALTVSASLAQIGEFSFILASLGTSLGLLPTQGRDLILAGAILSIALNPLAFAAIRPLARWLEQRSADRSQESANAKPAKLATDVSSATQRDHVVVVGYGRVGSVIGSILNRAGVPFTVVESDLRLAEALSGKKLQALHGEAMAESVLNAAGVQYARVLVLAIPDGYQARRVLQTARRLNPHIQTTVRTHSESEYAHLQNAGVDLVVLGERELALAMADYTLACFGLPANPRASPARRTT